jgi:8-oxo-dGTP pyrophosphatase MutT (NUDIX family)
MLKEVEEFHSISPKLFIFDEEFYEVFLLERSLLSKNNSGCFEPVGGKKKPEESFLEALSREGCEEIGSEAMAEVTIIKEPYHFRTFELSPGKFIAQVFFAGTVKDRERFKELAKRDLSKEHSSADFSLLTHLPARTVPYIWRALKIPRVRSGIFTPQTRVIQ